MTNPCATPARPETARFGLAKGPRRGHHTPYNTLIYKENRLAVSLNTDIILYRRLLGYVVPYWRLFVLSILGMIVLAATDPAIAALMQPLLDGAFIEKDPDIIARLPFLFVGLFLLRGVAGYVGNVSLAWVANRVVMDLRQAMFRRFIDYPAGFFDAHRSGDLMSRFTYDVTQIKEAATHAVTTLIRDSLSVIGLLAWMFYIDWLLAGICLIAAPVIGLLIAVIRQRLRKMSRRVQETMGDIHHALAECFDAQKVIKLYAGQEAEKRRFFRTTDAHRRFSIKFVLAATASSPAVQFIAAFMLAFVIHIATRQAGAGGLSVGDFVSFFTAVAMLLAPLKRLAALNEHIQKGLAACETVFALLDAEIEPQSGRRQLRDARGRLTFEGVSYRYPGAGADALSSVSLEIEPGETIALVGESGSGKTTLANLIPRFYEPRAGVIRYDNIDVRALSLDSLRRNIACVSQEVVLFNDTVRNNIAYGELEGVADAEIWAATEAACARAFIKALPEGLESMIGEHGTRLSGGQRQRLAIARALLKDAPLLILDEATSALDTRSERHIQSALDRLKQDRTCLIIAHRLSTIENADRIIVLDKGEIVEQGRHEALLKRQNHYARLHQMQFRQ